MLYAIENQITKTLLDYNKAFHTLVSAEEELNNLDKSIFKIKQVDLSDVVSISFNEDVRKIDFKNGEYVLVYGDIQSGKTPFILNLILHCIRVLKLSVVLLFRNNNADYGQCYSRVKEFNKKQKEFNLQTISAMHDISTNEKELSDLLVEPTLLTGLCNPQILSKIEQCFEENPKLIGKSIIVTDEGDLNSFEIPDFDLLTQTEEKLKYLFDKFFMFISVTGTPASVIFFEKITQLIKLKPPDNYYNIHKMKHVSVEPIRAKKRNQQYDPELDKDNLHLIMDNIFKKEKSTTLLTVSKLTQEHKKSIIFLSKRYFYMEKDLIFLEFNEKSVKIYSSDGFLVESMSDRIFKKISVGCIDQAIQKYKDVKHIVIVAGVLAGRGISFVSTDHNRHLTDQYIADSETSHLEGSRQGLRLSGCYGDNPNLTLYCSELLHDDLVNQSEDIKLLIDLLSKCISDKTFLPDLIKLNNEYSRKWFPPRKQKGILHKQEKSSPYTLVTEDYDIEENIKGYTIEPILTNIEIDCASSLLNRKWPVGSNNRDSEKVVYCNPMKEIISLEGIKSFLEKRKTKQKVVESLITEGCRHKASVKKLYDTYPEYEGKIVRKESNCELTNTFAKKHQKEDLFDYFNLD